MKLEAIAHKSYEGHKNDKYGDQSYIIHILQVVANIDMLIMKFEMYSDLEELNNLRKLGYLHDLLEDHPEFYKEEILPNIEESLHKSVEAISKREGEPINQYLKRCMEDKNAHYVKICDTMANLKVSVDGADFKRIEKYSTQLNKLLKGWSENYEIR